MRKLILTLLLLLCPSLASATIVRALTVEQMAQESDAVIFGTVSKQTSGWNDSKTRIYTVTTIVVKESWKGSHRNGASVNIRQIGGTVGQLTQRVVGNAKFTAGRGGRRVSGAQPERGDLLCHGYGARTHWSHFRSVWSIDSEARPARHQARSAPRVGSALPTSILHSPAPNHRSPSKRRERRY